MFYKGPSKGIITITVAQYQYCPSITMSKYAAFAEHKLLTVLYINTNDAQTNTCRLTLIKLLKINQMHKMNRLRCTITSLTCGTLNICNIISALLLA